MSRRIQDKRVTHDTTSKTKCGKNIDYYDGKKPVYNLGGGDSFYIPKFIKGKKLQDEYFVKLLCEINFVQMFQFKHETSLDPIPRMVQGQTDKTTATSSIYRMPGCNQSNIKTVNWTETVNQILELAKHQVNDPGLNHCVCTLYRDQNDSLGFHQDKIIDLEEDSLILSISFGAARPIVFQEMDGKKQQTIMLQPGSLLAIGKKTNQQWKHAVPKLDTYVEPRISLSIRHIKTFIEEKTDVISGKGEEYQTKNYPFTLSYDEPDKYSQEVKDKIESSMKEAQDKLYQMRAYYFESMSKSETIFDSDEDIV